MAHLPKERHTARLQHPTSPATIPPARWIVYRNIRTPFCAPFLTVFASVDRAVEEDALYSALKWAKTWGELRRRLPAGAWAEIREMVDDPDADEDDRICWDEDGAPFSSSQLSGWEDGSYPPVRSEHLGLEADEDWLAVLERAYHEVVQAAPYREIHWQVPPELAERVAQHLRQWGHHVEQAEWLEFC